MYKQALLSNENFHVLKEIGYIHNCAERQSLVIVISLLFQNSASVLHHNRRLFLKDIITQDTSLGISLCCIEGIVNCFIL